MPSRNWRTVNRAAESLLEILMTIDVTEDEREELAKAMKIVYQIRKKQ